MLPGVSGSQVRDHEGAALEGLNPRAQRVGPPRSGVTAEATSRSIRLPMGGAPWRRRCAPGAPGADGRGAIKPWQTTPGRLAKSKESMQNRGVIRLLLAVLGHHSQAGS